MKFTNKCTPTENIFSQYFYKGLQPSNKLWIHGKDGKDGELDGWDILINKATETKAKATF